MCVSPPSSSSYSALEKPQHCGSAPVRISSWLPECHMWCTLMRRIFNPADLHLQKFPLPVRSRNGSQTQPRSLRPSACVCVCESERARVVGASARVRRASVFVSLFSYLKLFWFGPASRLLPDVDTRRFTNSNFLD